MMMYVCVCINVCIHNIQILTCQVGETKRNTSWKMILINTIEFKSIKIVLVRDKGGPDPT